VCRLGPPYLRERALDNGHNSRHRRKGKLLLYEPARQSKHGGPPPDREYFPAGHLSARGSKEVLVVLQLLAADTWIVQ